MKKAGIWLDKTNAIVVELNGEGESVRRVESDVQGWHKATHGAPAPTKYGAQYDADERKRREQEDTALHKYMDELERILNGTDKLFVFGPGETRKLFAKRLEKSRKVKHIDNEASDVLDEKHVVLKVKEHFGIKPPRHLPKNGQ
jgi:hypothetical protein